MSTCITFLSPFLLLDSPHFLIQFPPLHLSLPSVQFLGNLLDAYTIKALLEVVGGDVNCENTVQVSFLHKFVQFNWCNALNVDVAVFFLDISSFCCLHSRPVHKSGRVGFGPNPNSTHQRRVGGQRNPKLTVGKIDRVGFR